VLNSLQESIRSNKGHLDTGIFGTRFFFEALAENGLNQLAYEAMNKKDYPGYGFWIASGSTTTREHWDNSGSHNHPMFGGGLVWFYRNLAGMQADPESPGYRHIVFKPQPPEGIDSVTYFNKTIYGNAGISWKKEGNRFLMDVKIPVGCEATVYVPVKGGLEVTFGDDDSTGITYLSREGDYQVFKVQSGEYLFVSKGWN